MSDTIDTKAKGFGAVRTALLILFRQIVGIYFRDVEIAGDVPRPQTGGRVFAANHVNGLVDPILVLTQAPCPISPVAKSTLWQVPGLKWLLDAADAVPIVRKRDDPNKSAKDNDAVFERVGMHLATGGNILIFPEGTSHNEPHLLALKSGAGRMLARAVETGGKGLTFQAVALEFDEREVFRSRTLILFGPVRSVEEVIRKSPDIELAQAITEVIRADLSELLVEGSTWEERILVVRAAEMFANGDPNEAAPPGEPRSRPQPLVQVNEIGRRIEEARRLLSASAPELITTIEGRVAAYFKALDDTDATDQLVVRFARRSLAAAAGENVGEEPAVAASLVAWGALRMLTLPLALVGMVLYWLPYQVPRAVTRRLKGDPDETSTYKLGVGLIVHPLWAAIAITLAFLRLPTDFAIGATVVVLTSPFAALPWLDRWDRLAPRMRLLGPREERREVLAVLATQRAALLKELEAARDQAFGPEASAAVNE
jgi:1-acyl-sn-glycerol-3-phosphate acyltransferase